MCRGRDRVPALVSAAVTDPNISLVALHVLEVYLWVLGGRAHHVMVVLYPVLSLAFTTWDHWSHLHV